MYTKLFAKLNNFTKKQKIIIGIILAIVAIILLNYVYSRESNNSQEIENLTTKESSEVNQNTEEEKKEIVVHVAGAVQTEGIIFLQEGDRISEAIEKAGGTTEEADMSQINLATQLEDGMKVYIPKKGEEVETQTASQINLAQETTKQNTQKQTSKININKATQGELETLPGIGPSTASKIVAYREENGKFGSIENIKDVSGIGDAKYNSIKDLITI